MGFPVSFHLPANNLISSQCRPEGEKEMVWESRDNFQRQLHVSIPYFFHRSAYSVRTLIINTGRTIGTKEMVERMRLKMRKRRSIDLSSSSFSRTSAISFVIS